MHLYPSARLEIFANSMFNRGDAAISGVGFRTSDLRSPIPGLDFDLMNRSFAEFSDLRIREMVHAAGFTYRLTDRMLANGTIEFHDYGDDAPYLYDATGRRIFTFAGVTWLF